MIYKFKSKVSADVIMMAPAGDKVLGILGKDAAPKGIIEPAQMAAAIQALSDAVAADDAARAMRQQKKEDGERQDDEVAPTAHDPVSLRQRAWPLVEMLKKAMAADEPVVWGV